LKSSTKTLVFAITVLLTASICHENAFAQNGQTQGMSGGYVTVLDVARVFKNYTPFTEQLKTIEAEAQALRNKLQAQEAELRAEAQAIVQQYKAGSAERRQAESQLEQKKAQMMTNGRHAQADLLNREAQLYYKTYATLQQVVTAYAKQANISLVIRFESNPIDSKNRGAVIKGVNRNVVYQDSMDITMAVLKQMHSAAGIAFDTKNLK
jgi:Skp family chaperone for outer membrane proteins